MKNFPSEYLYVDEEGNTFYKRYSEKKEESKVNSYTLASTPVVFSDKATVRTLFKLIEKNVCLKPFLFFFDEFNAELNKPKQHNIKGVIRFQWNEINLSEEYFNVAYPKMEIDGLDENNEPFGIEFLGVNEIADLPLLFNNDLVIMQDDNTILKSIYTHPTLFQVLYGLFWEFSFFGDPEQRDKHAKEIFNEVKELKELKDGSNN
jgi:hypothetical protein